MNVFFKKENLKTTILTAIYLFFGLMFCITTVKLFNFVESALCFVLLIGGFVCIAIYAFMSSEEKNFRLFIYGIIAVGFGFLMLVFSRFFGIFLSIIIGYNGVLLILQSLKDKSKMDKGWITSFVVGVIVVALSIVVIILSGTNVAKKILSIFFGIMLLVEGIFNLIQLIMMAVREKKNPQEIILNKEDVVVLGEGNEPTNQEKKG